MKTTPARMKSATTNLTLALAALGIITFLPRPAAAAISDADFQKLQQQFQELQKEHEQDRQEINQLKQSLGQTQKGVAEAKHTAAQAEAKAQQPVNPVPSEPSFTRNFVVAGSASAAYNKEDSKNGSFLLGSFSPIFLFRASDDILFESQLEFSLEDGETSTELEYAQMDYLANDYVTFIGGKFLLPLGQFPEKLHPTWVNKMPTMPLVYTGVGHLMHDTGIIPFTDVGVQARGATHVGQSDAVLTYSAYLVNGPGTGDDGYITFEAGPDLNGVPSGGGRFAVFYPWSPYHDFEVGVSGQTGSWNENDNLGWSALVADASMHLGPYTELRGEYVHTWQDTPGGDTLQPDGGYAQIAYKLAGLQLDFPVVNDLEAVFRYDYLNTDGAVTQARFQDDGGAVDEGRVNGYMLGLNYYIENTFIVKAGYEFITGNKDSLDHNRLTLQVTYGF